MTKVRVYPSITTTRGSDWKGQIQEIKKLGLKEICLFPTCLDIKKRRELYRLLKRTGIKRIPLVHLRSDMELWELDYLVKNYKVKAFNVHSSSRYPIINDFLRYKEKIYIENFRQPLNEKEVKRFSGICIDFSHLEDSRLYYSKDYKHNLRLIKKYPCGCAHISAFTYDPEGTKKYHSVHHLDNLSELNYLRKYPKKHFPSITAIELENSIGEQLRAKRYILKLLKR